MAIDDTKRFSFVSGGLPEDTFSVVKFKGTEGISRLYEFDVTLASDDPDIDLKEILQNRIAIDPYSGKKLVGDLSGFYSVRLSYQDRIVYSIDDAEAIVYIHRVKTHYGD